MKSESHYDQGWAAAQREDIGACKAALLALAPHHYREFCNGYNACNGVKERAE